MIGTVLTFFSGIAVAVLIGLLVLEARGQTLHRAQKIARKAAASLPPEHRAAYGEEWDALLLDMSDRPISALVEAVSLRVGARALSRQLTSLPVAAGADRDSDTEKPLPRVSQASLLDRLQRSIQHARGVVMKIGAVATMGSLGRDLADPVLRASLPLRRLAIAALINIGFAVAVVLAAVKLI